MKNLILLLLFIPLISFSQDFRKMSFGQSVEELKETYPEYVFITENDMGMNIFSHTDVVGGIEATVAYLFVDNKLSSGFYYFDRTNIFKSDDDRYKDFKSISLILNDKYEMQENNNWHDDAFKDDPTRNAFSLAMGYVDFSEMNSTDKVLINHTLLRTDGVYTHIVGYIAPSFGQLMEKKIDSDF
jgi:hypothetical protein